MFRRKPLDNFQSGSLYFLTGSCLEWFDLTSFSQLIQEIIGGKLKRHKFTPWELQLLFDIQSCRVRKSARSEYLRRYLKALQQQSAQNAAVPLTFSSFLEQEGKTRSIEAVPAMAPR